MTTQSENDAVSSADTIGDHEIRGGARATSYDVARLAGVSQSAVSRAFRDGGSISIKARKKVEDAARKLGYAPSQIARSLISQRSRMIAVVVTDPSSRAYPEILFYLGQEIQDTGNRMLVFALPGDENSGAVVRDILAYHVDGIVSSAVLDEEFLISCDRQNVPVVLFNRTPRSALASAVGCDHAAGMELLVSHLAARPMRRAAFLAGPKEAPVSQERLAGARSTFAQLGREIDHVIYSDYSFEGGRQGARELVGRSERPDTIICANDTMALGVMDACRYEFGLLVPDDVAVTGFDDVPQAAWPSYDLTTLRQPIRRMAQTAVRLLTEQIDGSTGGGERRLLSAELKVRKSTRDSR